MEKASTQKCEAVKMSKKVLVVDTEGDTIESIKSVLEDNGYEVVSAYSGVECLRKALEEKPDLVLVDTMMPDLSGWDLHNKLKKKDRDIKVAFLSVIELSNERREKLLLCGLSDYIKKPFTADELLERVDRILA